MTDPDSISPYRPNDQPTVTPQLPHSPTGSQIAPHQGPQPPYGLPPQPYHQNYGPPPQYLTGQQMAVAATLGRKEPALAGILSWLLPGVGQFYNGSIGAGVGFLIVYLVNLPFVIFFFWLVIPVIVGLGILVWSIIDAVLGAQRRNQTLAAHLMQGM